MMQPQAVSRCEDKPTQAQPSSSQTGEPGHQPMISGLHALQIQAFRNYPSAELGLQTQSGCADRAEWRGKNQFAGSCVYAGPGQGVAAGPARRNRSFL